MRTVCAKEYVDSVNKKVQAQFDKMKTGKVSMKVWKQNSTAYGGSVDVPVNFEDTNYFVQLTLDFAPYYGEAALSCEKLSAKQIRIHLWIVTPESGVTTVTFNVNWLAIHK